jgi:hypothetical protein
MVVGSCPTVFELLKLRKTKRYRSLRHHFFTAKEKLWLCSTLSTRKSEKRLSESQYKSHLLAVSTRYNISEDGLEEWMKAFHSCQILTAGICSSIYDDSPVDRAGVEVLQELMSQMRSTTIDEEDSLSSDGIQGWCRVLTEQIGATHIRRKQNRRSSVPKFKKVTYNRIKVSTK